MNKTEIAAYFCDNYAEDYIQETLDKTLNSLDIQNLITPNTQILIKPNLLSSYMPEDAITTHPSVVKAAVRFIKKAGAIPVIGDSPGNLLHGIEDVWQKTGMLKLAEEENVKLINFETAGSEAVTINHPTIKYVYVSKALLKCDGIINIPKLKTHTFMGFSCGIKNLYGCIPGARKIEYHKFAPTPYDFSILLSEIYRMLHEKIKLTILDGIIGIEGNGPSSLGEKRHFNILAASTDTAALDTFILNKISDKASKHPLIKLLISKKLVNTDLQNIKIIGSNTDIFNFKNTKFPVTRILNIIPRWIARYIGKYIGKFFWLKPYIQKKKCISCMQCIKFCPAKAIILKDNRPFINKKKCISCFCCHELCNQKTIDVETSFIAGLFIKK